jgi:hypothetical protein
MPPFKTTSELLAYAQENPQTLRVGGGIIILQVMKANLLSVSTNSTSHLHIARMMNQVT